MSDKEDDSKFGGETTPGVMDPGPQPKVPAGSDPVPQPDDPSKQGSG
jgi:hypothetical protein